uniref:Drebrin 1 n=1 Tax=Cyanistes caeruleus TaxID=156563 RepID=A0A8C0U792_CYACU
MAAPVMVAGLGHPSRPGLLSAAAPHPVCRCTVTPLADPSPSTLPASPPSQGTTYQKTDATVEMKRLNREQFWEQAKKEEELRKEEERKKALDARLRFEQERMEQERLEQEERERRYREREEQIEEHRRKQQSLEAEEARQRLKEQSIFGDQQDEDDRQQFRKSESEVEEAAAIIAQRPDNPRDFFKQQERVASGSSDAVSPGSHRTGRLHCPFIKTADSGPPSSSSSSSSPPRTPFPYISCHRTPNLSSFFPCSQSDAFRKASAAGCSPCESSPAATPLAEPGTRAPADQTPATPKGGRRAGAAYPCPGLPGASPLQPPRSAAAPPTALAWLSASMLSRPLPLAYPACLCCAPQRIPAAAPWLCCSPCSCPCMAQCIHASLGISALSPPARPRRTCCSAPLHPRRLCCIPQCSPTVIAASLPPPVHFLTPVHPCCLCCTPCHASPCLWCIPPVPYMPALPAASPRAALLSLLAPPVRCCPVCPILLHPFQGCCIPLCIPSAPLHPQATSASSAAVTMCPCCIPTSPLESSGASQLSLLHLLRAPLPFLPQPFLPPFHSPRDHLVPPRVPSLPSACHSPLPAQPPHPSLQHSPYHAQSEGLQIPPNCIPVPGDPQRGCSSPLTAVPSLQSPPAPARRSPGQPRPSSTGPSQGPRTRPSSPPGTSPVPGQCGQRGVMPWGTW